MMMMVKVKLIFSRHLKQFDGLTWLTPFSHMKKIKYVLRFSMAQERMYYLALPNTEQDIVHKMDFTDVIDLFTAAKH